MRSLSMPKAATLSSAGWTPRRNGASTAALAERLGDPGARRLGVGHRLDGGEGLRRDDEQRRCPGRARFSVSWMWAPSTLETKWRDARAVRKGASASVAIAGPRSEPPMPILTTSVIGSAGRALQRADGCRRRTSPMAASTSFDLGHHVLAVDQNGLCSSGCAAPYAAPRGSR